jgi:hypothetical protein
MCEVGIKGIPGEAGMEGGHLDVPQENNRLTEKVPCPREDAPDDPEGQQDNVGETRAQAYVAHRPRASVKRGRSSASSPSSRSRQPPRPVRHGTE